MFSKVFLTYRYNMLITGFLTFFSFGQRHPLNTTIFNARICFRIFFEGGLLLCKSFAFCFWLLLSIFFEHNYLQYIFLNFLHYSANPFAGPLGPFSLPHTISTFCVASLKSFCFRSIAAFPGTIIGQCL